jgi:uncharacterized protein (TIGR00369 family)
MAQLEQMTGYDLLRAMFDGEIPAAPIATTLGFAPLELERGRVVFTGTPGERHYNPIGSVHGGYAATLLDSAMGCAVHSVLDAGVGYTTLDLQVRYVRPMSADTGEVHAEGTVVHAGRRQAIAEGRLVSAADGKLLAHGTTTCLIL